MVCLTPTTLERIKASSVVNPSRNGQACPRGPLGQLVSDIRDLGA
jgi:hypothetical protein